MSSLIGQSIDSLDTPQLLIDLDVVDANLERMFAPFRGKSVNVRVHFKSLKCAGLAKHIASKGGKGFLCAKLNEAEVLADAGLTDILIANQIVGPIKVRRLAQLARRAQMRVCVDDEKNIDDLSRRESRPWLWPATSRPAPACASTACRATTAICNCLPTRPSAAPNACNPWTS
jgi:D-serine deaminase-like pyridoxal phosphate-dependent protein